MKEEKETVGNPLTGGSVGSFGISEGTTTGRGKKQNPQNRCLTATASGEVAQTLTSTTSERGLDREVWAASTVLRVRTGPECPEDNLRELTQDKNPNCGISRGTNNKKKILPAKGSNASQWPLA